MEESRKQKNWKRKEHRKKALETKGFKRNKFFCVLMVTRRWAGERAENMFSPSSFISFFWVYMCISPQCNSDRELNQKCARAYDDIKFFSPATYEIFFSPLLAKWIKKSKLWECVWKGKKNIKKEDKKEVNWKNTWRKETT